MNAVEIEAAVSDLAAQPFDPYEFPYEFLRAFDKKETTLKRLRRGDSNKSGVPGAVLLQANIHIAVCSGGETRATLERLKADPKTAAARAKFVLATDGMILEAEDLATGEAIAPDYPRFAEKIGFFLPLAGISTVLEIKDNPIDVRATGRLNKLYVELLHQNPAWGAEARRHDMNHFMARLIFCFFAEDTDIFHSRRLFTSTVEQWSESDGSNTHLVIEAVFRTMNKKAAERNPDNTPGYAITFPYVNGGLFSGSTHVPHFTRIARSYLLQAGSLDWQHINPDIFGSMIQAVADEEERGALGMHYTSVPNILKVLNPLFLDDLRAALEAAGDNVRTLLNLRRRLRHIRVFDPACGSGNFLVIAYKEMRKIEAEINRRRGEHMLPTVISKKNFRGIEIRDFASEVARLALVIAEYQCDVLHRGPLAAKAEFLPLDEMNWITCGNALRLDWLKVCPPEGTRVKLHSDDLFQTPLEQPEIDFENEGGETYICGNPPYLGSTWQSDEQKSDLESLFASRTRNWRSLDYVSGWFIKVCDYGRNTRVAAAYVSTNSLCQGQHVAALWPLVFASGFLINFAFTSFKWANLASRNAGVTTVIVGITQEDGGRKTIFTTPDEGDVIVTDVPHINAYLAPSADIIIRKRSKPFSALNELVFGSKPADGGGLVLSRAEVDQMQIPAEVKHRFILRFVGSEQFIDGNDRYCVWVGDAEYDQASLYPPLARRFEQVVTARLQSTKPSTLASATTPYKFTEIRQAGDERCLIVPSVSSEEREYLPVGLLPSRSVVSNLAFAMFDAPLWNMALIASKIHLVWVATVCGKLETRYRYSNTLGWNTFPIPTLTEQNKADLTRCAEDILLAREAHFPDTIADLYDPETMPANLRAAHDANDEVLERIYIGRRFRNDTERLETLFAMYAKMQGAASGTQNPLKKTSAKKQAAKVGQ